MALKDLLKSSEDAAPKSKGNAGDDLSKVQIVDMSKKSFDTQDGTHVPGNQGTIYFCPVTPLYGAEVAYIYNVLEFKVENNDGNQFWSKVLEAKDYMSELTDEDKALISKTRSNIQKFMNDEILDYREVRSRNYALIFGYIFSHTNLEKEVLVDNESRKMACLVFPSKGFAKALTACLNNMQAMGEEVAEEMYADLFNRNLTRNCFIEASFSKSEGFGYDCTLAVKTFDRFSASMLKKDEKKDMAIQIPQELIDQCECLTARFVAGNLEGKEDFNREYVLDTYSQCQGVLKYMEAAKTDGDKLPPLPNNNGGESDWNKEDE